VSTQAGGESTSATANLPSGVAVNDVLVAYLTLGPNASAVQTPSGWTPVTSAGPTTYFQNNTQQLAYYLVVTSTPVTPPQFTWTNSAYFSVRVADYTGVNTTAPMDKSGTAASASSPVTSLSAASLVPSQRGDQLLISYGSFADAVNSVSGTPSLGREWSDPTTYM